MQTTYDFFSSPSHGWLKVPLHECLELGILPKVSQFSYIDVEQKCIYLEEDSDADIFFKAKAETLWNNDKVDAHERSIEDDSFIRNLPHHNAEQWKGFPLNAE